MCEGQRKVSIDTKTPAGVPLTAFYKRSFAYYTVKERYPVILTQLIDDLVRNKQEIAAEYGTDSDEDLKCAIGEISKLKYEIQTNKPLPQLIADDCNRGSEVDIVFYNNYLAQETSSMENPPPDWYNSKWLHNECFMHRKLRDIFYRTKTLQQFDHYRFKKEESFLKSQSHMVAIGLFLPPAPPMKICNNKLPKDQRAEQPPKNQCPPPPVEVPKKPVEKCACEKATKNKDVTAAAPTVKAAAVEAPAVEVATVEAPAVENAPVESPVIEAPAAETLAAEPGAEALSAEATGGRNSEEGTAAGEVPPPPGDAPLVSGEKPTEEHSSTAGPSAGSKEPSTAKATMNVEEQFKELLKMNLWGNKCDLSFSQGAVTFNLQEINDSLKSMDKFILIDDTDLIWNALNNKDATSTIVDIVLDNAGYELFLDLCLADFLISSKLAEKIRFYVKAIPWYISDVTAADFHWTLRQLGNHESQILQDLSKRWWDYLNNGIFSLDTHSFWTLPVGFSKMKEIDPELYEKLGQAKLIVFKGDLNYRKLHDDINFAPTTKGKAATQGFFPANLCSIRTVKCDILCGLNEGQMEELEKKSPDWGSTGEYAVIFFFDGTDCKCR